MKKFILQTLSYLMVGVVFMSSTGFGLVEHSCLMSGKTERMIVGERSCCAKKKADLHSHQNKNTTDKKADCCTFDTEYTNVEFSTSIVQVFSKLLLNVSVAILHAFTFLFNLLVDVFRTTVHVASSPSLSGRDLLKLFHLLRI